MRFYVKNLHWLDAMTPPLEAHLARLVETISNLLGAKREAFERAGADRAAASAIARRLRISFRGASEHSLAE